jgi:hypothetical protein
MPNVSFAGIGNQLGSLFGDFLYALVTNRTFLLVSHATQGECTLGFSFHPWIPLYVNVSYLNDKHKCGAPLQSTLINPESCGALGREERVIDPASNHDHNSHVLIFNRVWDSSISDFHIGRINTVMKHTYYDNHRFYAYGFIQLYMLQLTQLSRRLVHDIWKHTLTEPDSIRISMHIRYATES